MTTRKRTAGLLARTLILFAVVPAVVLSSSRAAEASTYGPVGHATVKAKEPGGPYSGTAELSCEVAAAYKRDPGEQRVVASANCDRDANLAADMAASFGYVAVEVSFNGTTTSGAPCSAAFNYTGVDSGGQQATGLLGGALAGNVTDCAVVETCVDWTYHAKFYGDSAGFGCAPIDLGDIPAPNGSTCALGYPTGDVRTEWSVSGGDNYYRIWTEINSTAAYATHWFAKAYVRDTVTGVYSTQWHDSGYDFETSGARTVAAGGTAEHYIRWRVLTGSLHPMEVLGIELQAVQPTAAENPPSGGPVFPNGGSMTQSMHYPPTATYTASGSNYWGITDQAICRFYIGSATYASSDATGGVPFAPLNLNDASPPPSTDPPDTTPSDGGSSGEDCGFSVSDPGTWAAGGMCAAVGLLGKIVGLLGDIVAAVAGLAADIAGAIVGALGGLLSDLFVPESPPSFGDVSVTVPTGWTPELPAITDTGGGCGALVMPELSMGFGGGHFGPTTLANTCAAPWPLIRTFTYNGTLALVLVSVVRAAFRALMNALGMGVEAVGGGSGDR